MVVSSTRFYYQPKKTHVTLMESSSNPLHTVPINSDSPQFCTGEKTLTSPTINRYDGKQNLKINPR